MIFNETTHTAIFSFIRVPNHPFRDCTTYLHLAAKTGQVHVFKEIFQSEKKKDLEKCFTSSYGKTPFYLACKLGHSKIVEILLNGDHKIKINLDTKDQNGWSAFHHACAFGHLEVNMITVVEFFSEVGKIQYSYAGCKWHHY